MTPRPLGRPPWPLLLAAGLALLWLTVPLLGLLVRAPWPRAAGLLAEPEALQALGLSLGTATVATVVVLLLGVPLAWVLSRPGLPGAGVLRALVTVPLILPPVVGGVALLTVLGRSGLLGAPLHEATGLALPFTPAAVVVAQVFVGLPFLVLSVEGSLRALDPRSEEVAATLGASAGYTFTRVTLPTVAPGVLAGAVLAWARALGEFGATITFAGNFPGRTRTVPLEVYLALQSDPDAAVLLSVVLMAVSLVVLVLLRGRWVNRW
ncbi:molybdate ABC transporter permease subunit [Desertihabitans brevis]|uniref:Molybdenum transport system permease n=1 Tax=Desertihabitans brevis TaxID=2268447 RepID=A0A367YXI7_9ACTN|nr:ABC transporter permease [Desertihabitans brevis]RCK69722.1 molybdate ABC transporter permease subunit [Desertihabitans brevis]